MRYRRLNIPGASYFFTICLADRKSNLLIDKIHYLKNSFKIVKQKHPFKIDSIVILPDHLHMIMTLPPDDKNYSMRWNLIKGYFSRQILKDEIISQSRRYKRERNIWQRRFWEHVIQNEDDYEQHVNYIHYNPVKHSYVEKPDDWKFSSIHSYIEQGILIRDWGGKTNFPDTFGE